VRSVLTALCIATALTGQAFAQSLPPTRTVPADPTLAGQTTEWQVCNETSYVVRTASAFMRGAGLSAKGWEMVLPGSCIALTTPQNGPRFLYAESIDAHQGEAREWKGTTPLCVDGDADFTSEATQDCRLANRVERDYFAVRPGEPVTTLTEPSDYGRNKALVAAQQRLLRDAGYSVSRIDGITGRRTSRLLRDFRRDKDLPASLTGEPLLLALIEAARTAQSNTGLEVCNDGSADIWTAVALREDDGGWRSRGWWRARPDQCTRPLNIPLDGAEVHIFALQDDGEGGDLWMRSVSTTPPAQFCIAESQFDALGNEMCADQGYSVASFRPVEAEDSRARVRLTDSDFAAQQPGGLRR
jgi:uncharacterized membrane protein